jgi:hypothetical protein
MNTVNLNRPQAIKAFLNSARKSRADVQLWQNTDKKRVIYTAKIELVDTLSKDIIVRTSKIDKIDLIKNSEIYFHSPYRGLLFKSTIKLIERKRVIISFPSLIRFQDARSEKRTHVGKESYHFATVSLLTKFKEKIHTKLKVLDFSGHGLALIVNKYIYNSIQLNEKIIIRETTVNNEIKDAVYIIRNLGDLTNNLSHSKEFRVGLELCA